MPDKKPDKVTVIRGTSRDELMRAGRKRLAKQPGPPVMPAHIATEVLLESLYRGETERAIHALDAGASLSAALPESGMTALHIAVAENNIILARLLLDRGATVGPDKLGLWPSMIAGLCEVSEEMCDLVVEAEEKVEATGAPQPTVG